MAQRGVRTALFLDRSHGMALERHWDGVAAALGWADGVALGRQAAALRDALALAFWDGCALPYATVELA